MQPSKHSVHSVFGHFCGIAAIAMLVLAAPPARAQLGNLGVLPTASAAVFHRSRRQTRPILPACCNTASRTTI